MYKRRDYLEQIQLVIRAGLEVGISRFKVRRPYNTATLPSYDLPHGSPMLKQVSHRCAVKATLTMIVRIKTTFDLVVCFFSIYDTAHYNDLESTAF